MELVEGPSLAGVLAGGPLSARRTMDVVAQVASGLQAAHDAGLIHRDVKPANILFAPGGTVRITDFGIAHAIGSAPVTATGMVMGTPGYIAPERVTGAQAGPASDLYALGVVAYECLAGSPPFSGGALDVAIAHRDRPLPPLPASVPADVVAFVMTLAAKDPAWRPGSAGEVAHQAARLRDSLPPDAARARPAFLATPEDSGVPEAREVPRGPRVPRAVGALGAIGASAAARSTVADGPASPAWAPAAGPARPRRRRRALTAAALALAALTCLVLISVTGFSSAPHRAGPSSPARSPAAPAVTGSRAATTSPSATASSATQPASQPPSASPAASPAASPDSPSPSQDPASASAPASAAQHGHKKGHGHGNGNSQ